MKYSILILLFGSISEAVFSQGTDCSNATPLTLNGSINNFSTSSSTGSNVLCANNGTTPITWFSLTTNAAGESPLLNVTAADGQPVEISMYTSCSGNMNNNLEITSSMCFDDGTGLWAPAHNYVLTPNTTYYLRIKTASSTNLQIEARSYAPSNNNCNGATPIDDNLFTDNNATHKPGPGLNPPDLCAASIENTAYYQYNVAATGTSIINISSISCDNGAGNNISGFQIGFFTGTCGSLTWLSPCFSGSGSLVQATTPVLAAGTKVYVAIDGFEGSNCQYDIQAINAITLSSNIKKFSGWKNQKGNLLTWESESDLATYFEIERSSDGVVFTTIGKIEMVYLKKSRNYEFEDFEPTQKAWYRLKEIMADKKIRFSKTVSLIRQETPREKLQIVTTNSVLSAQFYSNFDERSELMVTNTYGQPVVRTIFNCHKGLNNLTRKVTQLPAGMYFVILKSKHQNLNASFINSGK